MGLLLGHVHISELERLEKPCATVKLNVRITRLVMKGQPITSGKGNQSFKKLVAHPAVEEDFSKFQGIGGVAWIVDLEIK